MIFKRGKVYENTNSVSFSFAPVFVIIPFFSSLQMDYFDKKVNYILRIKASKTCLLTYLLSKLVVQFWVVILLMLM